MKPASALCARFDRDGRVWFRDALSEADLAPFDAIAAPPSTAGQRIPIGGNLSTALYEENALTRVVRKIEPNARPVRLVAFDKTSDTNWGLPWHQDRVIAVAERHDVKGFGNWTRKAGTWHCEPPPAVLDGMLFVRLHLDNTNAANGAMLISAGSHSNGLVPGRNAELTALRYPVESCNASRGDVLVLKMLTLHASKRSKSPSSRRVLRIDFANFDLPRPLEWAWG